MKNSASTSCESVKISCYTAPTEANSSPLLPIIHRRVCAYFRLSGPPAPRSLFLRAAALSPLCAGGDKRCHVRSVKLPFAGATRRVRPRPSGYGSSVTRSGARRAGWPERHCCARGSARLSGLKSAVEHTRTAPPAALTRRQKRRRMCAAGTPRLASVQALRAWTRSWPLQHKPARECSVVIRTLQLPEAAGVLPRRGPCCTG